jgi:hypothetical protein
MGLFRTFPLAKANFIAYFAAHFFHIAGSANIFM